MIFLWDVEAAGSNAVTRTKAAVLTAISKPQSKGYFAGFVIVILERSLIMEVISGIAKAALEKHADPLISKITKLVKSKWEKFKIDSDIAFTKYLESAYEKYSKIKTILYRTEPKYIYDFFEHPYLLKDRSTTIYSSDVNNLLDVSHFLIISGTGGIGKSTFMKHLFINELSKKDLIPIFLELKDLNDISEDYNISDFVFAKLYNLGCDFNKDYIEYALKSGCFLFLLDGYDEIISSKRDGFFKKITNFCDRYSENFFIISSRPYTEFIEFQRFSVLTICKFTKQQAISLINKIEYEQTIKSRFITDLDASLYDKHTSFASNPLLLNIMLLTYDNYAEIPEKLHLFYSNAFDTLYSKHDATKGGYKRELKSKLSFDSFKKVFSYFCFVTYYNGKIEFTYDELVEFLNKSKLKNAEFEIAFFVDDLINSICVLYKDGLNYRFTHRSFQEYFTAIFLKELSDENLNKMSIQLILKDAYRATHDNTFAMLLDMCEERVEQNVFIPLLNIIESDIGTSDRYDFYFKKFEPILRFDYYDNAELQLAVNVDSGDNLLRFIRKFSHKYYAPVAREDGDTKLLNHLQEAFNYTGTEEFFALEHREDFKLYELIKESWLGAYIMTLSNLKNILIEKKREEDVDLSDLLS